MTIDRGMRIHCEQVVELITDYLEGRLDGNTRLNVEAHLEMCDSCVVYIEQMRETIATLGHVPLETLSDEAKSTLLDAFRNRTV